MPDLSWLATFDTSGFSKGEKEIENSINRINKELESIGMDLKFKDAADAAGVLNSSIKANEEEIRRLKQETLNWQNAINEGGLSKGVVKEMSDYIKDNQLQIRNLTNETANYKKYLKEIDDAQKSSQMPKFTVMISTLENDMKHLRMAGKQNTDEYKQMEEALKKLRIEQAKFKQEVKNNTTGATYIGATLQGLQGLAGGYSAAIGAMGMFGAKEEDMIKIQTKLQSSMSVLMGLQQLSNTLHETSAFRITILSKVQAAWNAVTNASSKAMKALKVALASTGIGALVVALGFAVSKISDWITKTKEQREEQKKLNKELREQSAQIASKNISSINALATEWKKLKTQSDKNQFLKDRKKDFDDLGVSIKNVADIENLLVKNKDKFVKSEMLKAQATVLRKQAEAKTEELLKQKEIARTTDKKKLAEYGGFMFGGAFAKGDDYRKVISDAKKKATELETELKGMYDEIAQKQKLADDIIDSGNIKTKSDEKAEKEENANQAKADKLAEQQRKRLEAQREFSEKIADDIVRIQQKISSAKLGLNESKHEQIKNELNKLDVENKKVNDEIAKYKREAVESYDKAFGTKEKRFDTFESLPEDVQKSINDVTNGMLHEQSLKNEKITQELLNNLLEEYSDFEKKRTDIHTEYEDRRGYLDLMKQGETDKKRIELIESATKELNRAEKQELEANSIEQRNYIKANSEVLKKAFGNTAITTRKQLEEAIGIVEKYRQILGADNEEDALKIGKALGLSEEETKNVIANGAQVAEEIQAIDDKLNGLKSQRTGLKKIADDFKDLAKSAKEGGLDFTENLQAVLDFANGISNAVESIASYMNEIASISGDDKLARRAQSISNAVSVVNSTANGALRGAQLTGNVAGAVLGGVIGFSISLIEKSSKANAENAKRANEMTEALKEYFRTVESAKLDSMFKDSIFGSGGFSNAISRIKTLEEEWENLNEGEYRHNPNGKDYTVYDERIQQFNKFLRLYGSIFDILDEKGNVIVENLRSLLDSGGVADNYKEGVEFALSYLEKIEEATNELNNELSNLFGSLGDNLAQSMFDAFAEGEDAGKAMFDTLDSLEKSFAKTLMKDFANKWLANNFGNDIDNIANMTSNEDVESSISSLLLNIRSLLPNLETGLKTIYDSFGFSESMSASSSTAKGIAQASQDSVDELNGRFTAIQSHTYSINESIKDMQSRQATILNEIMGIHTDTSSLKTMFTNGTARVRLER